MFSFLYNEKTRNVGEAVVKTSTTPVLYERTIINKWLRLNGRWALPLTQQVVTGKWKRQSLSAKIYIRQGRTLPGQLPDERQATDAAAMAAYQNPGYNFFLPQHSV